MIIETIEMIEHRETIETSEDAASTEVTNVEDITKEDIIPGSIDRETLAEAPVDGIVMTIEAKAPDLEAKVETDSTETDSEASVKAERDTTQGPPEDSSAPNPLQQHTVIVTIGDNRK